MTAHTTITTSTRAKSACAQARNARSASRVAVGSYSVRTVEKADKRQQRRALNYAMKATASALLKDDMPKASEALAGCGRRAIGGGHTITFKRTTTAQGEVKASVEGVQTCGKVWLCPDCSAKLAAERAEDANKALLWAKANGIEAHMLTLTQSHERKHTAKESVEAQKGAVKALRQSHSWRALPLIGSITGTECTHADRNGYHVHNHIILFGPTADQIDALFPEWQRSAEKVGRKATRNGWDISNATEAGAYVAKMGAAAEVTMQGMKSGRNGSSTPMELLAAAAEGCKRSAAIWCEYAIAFQGVKALVWSNGLRAKVEKWHEEQAAQDDGDGDGDGDGDTVEIVLQLHRGSLDWQYARRRIVAIKNAIEQYGDVEAALYGPSDEERWRVHLDTSRLIE